MLRLMIVDDEEIIREALSSMIDYASIGYEVIATAKNGMEAYDMICDEYPDVVITDIRMPILNGLDLIERSMKTDSKITFILLSGYNEFEYAKQAMKYGVRYYLSKPTDKQELIEALIAVREEKEQKERQRAAEQNQLVASMQAPLEQSLIMEALESGHVSQVFGKYQSLLSIPTEGLCACICSFLEESLLESFLTDLGQILRESSAERIFPVIYVKNSALFLLSSPSLAAQAAVKERLEALSYPGQSVSLDVSFLHADTSRELFEQVVFKISRYERILLIRPTAGEMREIHNHIAAPWRIKRLHDTLEGAQEPEEIYKLLDEYFSPSPGLEAARALALGLFLKQDADSGQPLDIACDFFRRLYSCESAAQIRELAEVALLSESPPEQGNKGGVNIGLLKTYVEEHLDSETLSLKWLAQNYLFVSVGYLSKQFVKEEGIRFSDYLNRRRMEQAIRLMVYYHNDNIKTIAKAVGFGNNPQYFSQVFKRYTGSTPTDYIEKIKGEEEL